MHVKYCLGVTRRDGHIRLKDFGSVLAGAFDIGPNNEDSAPNIGQGNGLGFRCFGFAC